jgi:hypothetical protein
MDTAAKKGASPSSIISRVEIGVPGCSVGCNLQLGHHQSVQRQCGVQG